MDLLNTKSRLIDAQIKIVEGLLASTDLTVSQWAQRDRYLSSSVTAVPGRYDLTRYPYWTLPLDLLKCDTVEEQYFCFGSQLGKTEFLKTAIGYLGSFAPATLLLALPDEPKCNEWIQDRIPNLIKTTASLKGITITDQTKEHIYLSNGFRIYPSWSGSKNTFSERSLPYVIADELTNFQPPASVGSIVAELLQRTIRYAGRGRKALMSSTPDDERGAIWQAVEGSTTKLHFYIPLGDEWHLFDFENLRSTNDKATPQEIERDRLAVYQFDKHTITDATKTEFVSQGKWGFERDGKTCFEENVIRSSRSIGWQLSSLYSPDYPLSSLLKLKLEAEEKKRQGDDRKIKSFFQLQKGMPYRQERSEISINAIQHKVSNAPERKITDDTIALLTSADNQTDCFYFTTFAWRYDGMAYLYDWGKVTTKEELMERVYTAPVTSPNGTAFEPYRCFLDVQGNREHEIKQLIKNDPGKRLVGIRGNGAETARSRQWEDRTRAFGFPCFLVPTNRYKNQLWKMLTAGRDEPRSINLEKTFCANLEIYGQLVVEKCHYDSNRKIEVWENPNRRDNHYWDCMVYNLFAADMLGILHRTSPEAQQKQMEQIQKQREQAPQVKPEAPAPTPAPRPTVQPSNQNHNRAAFASLLKSNMNRPHYT